MKKLSHGVVTRVIYFLIICLLLITVMENTALALEGTALTLEADADDVLPMQNAGFTATNLDFPLVSNRSDEVTVDYAANSNGSYEWYYSDDYSTDGYSAYIAGNSGKKIACVSNISITVNGIGSFSFDFMTSTYKSGDGYALYYKIGEPITLENYTTAVNYKRYTSFRGEIPWTAEQFNIKTEDLDDDGKATVFIAYLRTGTLTGTGSNTVAIANVCFTSGEKTLTINIEDDEYGVVKDSEIIYSGTSNTVRYNSGEAVTLTSVPAAGARFYGWVDGDGRFLTTNDTYSFMISEDKTLKAVFSKEGRFVARRNGIFYTNDAGGLIKALFDAEMGDIVVMLEDQALSSGSTVVPFGARLYIPYSAEYDEDGYADGVSASESPYIATPKIASPDKAYCILTIEDGATLMVEGTLNIGGVIGYPSQYYQGHTSGWHGRINNEGEIVVKDSGSIDCRGFIAGNGTVTAQKGGAIYEPFIVYDYAGAWNTERLYSNGQSPFKQYAMQNIQTILRLNPGSKLYARCNLWAGNEFHKTDVIFIGEKGLFQPHIDTTVTRTFYADKTINTNKDIGKTAYTFNGGMTVGFFEMTIEGILISTKNIDFPIPYNTDILLENGDYYPGRIKLMPGATMIVGNDANLIVEKTLYILDGLIQSDMSGKTYPSTRTLQDSGFSASGQLFVNGSIKVKNGAIFGGVVQAETSEGPRASMEIEEGAIIDCKDVIDGAVGEYDVNTSAFDLPARACILDPVTETYAVEELIPGMTYSSHDLAPWSADGYTMTYAENCSAIERSPDIPAVDGKFHKWVVATVSLDEDRVGTWVPNYSYYTFSVVNTTVDNAMDSTRTEIRGANTSGKIRAGGDIAFTVSTTKEGKGYLFTVLVRFGDDPPVELNADSEGKYTVTNVENDVLITVTSWKPKDPPGGGGGGTPWEEPKTESVAVLIPGSTITINIPIVIEGTTAKLDMTEKDLGKILAENILTGPVIMDFGSFTQKIDKVNIPAEVLKTINMASQTGEGAAEGMRIALSMGIIEFDAPSLASISGATDKGNLTVLIDEAASLTKEQKAAAKGNPVYDIRVENDRGLVDFDGNITIYLPYTLDEGQSETGVVVYYIDSGGHLVNMNANYDLVKKMAYFTTTHLSLFMVDYDSSLHICPSARYVDVDPSLWYHEAVDFVIERGLFEGTGDSTFEPDTAMSRAMLATVMWRLEGKTTSFYSNVFKDVKDGSWYTDAVAWATDNGIFSGYGNGMFGPDDNITREQMAVIMYRYAINKDYDTAPSDKLTAFSDAKSVSDWALAGTKWAVAKRLIEGMSEMSLDPRGSATRAQVAAMLMRFVMNVIE